MRPQGSQRTANKGTTQKNWKHEQRINEIKVREWWEAGWRGKLQSLDTHGGLKRGEWEEAATDTGVKRGRKMEKTGRKEGSRRGKK